MQFLFLNQTFYPDVVSSAQHLADLAVGLVARGHQVTVVTGRRAYDDPKTRFLKQETWRGIRTIRIGGTGFGKGSRGRRAADFASFLALCLARVAFVPRPDVIVALSSPPLISWVGAWLAKLRRARFCYWVMDLNPDEAVAAGWLLAGSLVAELLERCSRFSLRRADRIIALDHFMRDRIISKGVNGGKVRVIPPWSHESEVGFDAAGRERFRKEHGLGDKFVVMYSGNHSPCHPLDTLLAAAEGFRNDDAIAFCFVGGGAQFKRVEGWARERGLHHVRCLPYRPLSELSGSLSAADLHAVVMGDEFVGLVHPCKIYNILRVASPVLYIGPAPSHITEISQAANGEVTWLCARHGDAAAVAKQIQKFRAGRGAPGAERIAPRISSRFSKAALLPKLIAELESV